MIVMQGRLLEQQVEADRVVEALDVALDKDGHTLLVRMNTVHCWKILSH